MEHSKIVQDAITFDDVLLIPARTDFVPSEADTRTKLTRQIELNIPLVSAPMDTVTESALAIALAQEGGIGIINKNLSAENQAREVEKVKRSENGVIVDPITLPPTATIGVRGTVFDVYLAENGKLAVTYSRTPFRSVRSAARWRGQLLRDAC